MILHLCTDQIQFCTSGKVKYCYSWTWHSGTIKQEYQNKYVNCKKNDLLKSVESTIHHNKQVIGKSKIKYDGDLESSSSKTQEWYDFRNPDNEATNNQPTLLSVLKELFCRSYHDGYFWNRSSNLSTHIVRYGVKQKVWYLSLVSTHSA